MLMCDFGDLRGEVRKLEAAGVPALHLDVMDGHFVNNLTYGLPLVETFRRLTTLPLDVHVMIANPAAFAASYVEAGADAVTFHIETPDDAARVLSQIKAAGAAAGIALNPDTPAETIEDCLPLADQVLVMSVPPGRGGQAFRPVALEKLDLLRKLREERGLDFALSVDGGVKLENIDRCAAAGAELFVVGSGIFRAKDYSQAVAELKSAANRPPKPRAASLGVATSV